jgi:hypothetical protein
MVNLTKPRTL